MDNKLTIPQVMMNSVTSPSQAYFWNLLNSMPDPIFVKDRRHQWIFLNDACCKLVGQSRETLLERVERGWSIDNDPRKSWQTDELVFTTGAPAEQEGTFTNAWGQAFVASIHKSLFYGEDGQPFLICSIRQIASAKQMATELQESKRLMQLVIDNIPQLIFWKDLNSVYLGCNQNYAQAVGLETPEQIVGKTDYDLSWSREDAERYRERDRQVIQSQQPVQAVVTRRQKIDGSEIWVEINKFPLYDSTGQIIGILGTYEDITERRRAEEVLRQSEATNRALIEAIPDLLIRMRSDGTYLNVAFEGNFKPTAIQVPVGKKIYDLLPPDLAQQRMHYTQKALKTGELQIYDQELLVHDQLVYEEVRIMPSGDDEVLTMVRDVTARKQAELALQQLNEELEQKVEERTVQLRRAIKQLEQEICDRKRAKVQLQEQEHFLRSIYEGIEHQIFVVNITPDGEFQYGGWNRFTEEALGIRSKDALGKSPEEIFGPDEGGQIRKRYYRCLQIGRTTSYEECVTFQDKKSWFITTLNPLKNTDGQIYCLVGTTFNITDRKQAETALFESENRLRQQAEELQASFQELQRTQLQLVQSEKMSSLGQLVAGVAHEINNPVNFIYGNIKHARDYIRDLLNLLHLYQEHYPNPAIQIQEEAEAIDIEFLTNDLPKLLNSMKVGAERIQQIVASLRTFSRMDEAEMKAVNIHECIDSTLMILQSRLKARPDRARIEVIRQYSQMPLVECYAGQLNQVFMNILSNAIDALEDMLDTHATFTPVVTIRAEMADDNRVLIQISDNGIGIPTEKKARIFDPFFTTKTIGKGTGLGLSISYQIVTEKHGGKLWCQSELGEGTHFFIEIPACQDGQGT